MLTILAFIVFIPALIWNIILVVAVIETTVNESADSIFTKKNFTDVAISLAFLLVPGVYLFGWQ